MRCGILGAGRSARRYRGGCARFSGRPERGRIRRACGFGVSDRLREARSVAPVLVHIHEPQVKAAKYTHLFQYVDPIFTREIRAPKRCSLERCGPKRCGLSGAVAEVPPRAARGGEAPRERPAALGKARPPACPAGAPRDRARSGVWKPALRPPARGRGFSQPPGPIPGPRGGASAGRGQVRARRARPEKGFGGSQCGERRTPSWLAPPALRDVERDPGSGNRRCGGSRGTGFSRPPEPLPGPRGRASAGRGESGITGADPKRS